MDIAMKEVFVYGLVQGFICNLSIKKGKYESRYTNLLPTGKCFFCMAS